jgi:hypothetical protein
MTAYELPTSLNISGVDFSIRTDFRAIIDILVAMNDPELDEQAKAVVMLQILFEDWQSIPPEHLSEACQKACEFIDCGQADDNPNRPKPRLMDWEQDGDMIVPAVNKVAGKSGITPIPTAPRIPPITAMITGIHSSEIFFDALQPIPTM